jgi:23S rRNA pseudouridine2605 synthase
MSAETKGERLHKVLAHAGVASRRKCEDLIREGRVRVNGSIVTEMGVRVDLGTDVVELDNERVRPEPPVYFLVYKPTNVLCTTNDQWGRKTVLDLVPAHHRTRLFMVGRLDLDAEGLVIVTNDGDFTHDVLHPKRRLPRTYWVKVRGSVGPDEVRRAREGVWLSDGRTPPMEVHVLRAGREVTTAKCTFVERHHHQLKRIWAKLGTPVLKLVLVRIASVGTERLKKGAVRPLTPAEVEDLRSGPPGETVDWSERKRAPRAPVAEKEEPVAWGTPAARADDERPAPRRRLGASRERPPRGGPPRRDRRGAPHDGPPRGPRRGPSERGGRRGPPQDGPRGRPLPRSPRGAPPQRGPRALGSSSGRAFRKRGRKS